MTIRLSVTPMQTLHVKHQLNDTHPRFVPQMGHVPSGPSKASITGADPHIGNVSCQEPPDVVQALKAGDVLNSSGRGRSTDTRHRDGRADFTVDPVNLPQGRVTGGSYLQLHLLHSAGKNASATRWQ